MPAPQPAPPKQPQQPQQPPSNNNNNKQYPPKGKRGQTQQGYGFHDYNDQGYGADDAYVQISVDVGAANDQVYSYACEFNSQLMTREIEQLQ